VNHAGSYRIKYRAANGQYSSPSTSFFSFSHLHYVSYEQSEVKVLDKANIRPDNGCTVVTVPVGGSTNMCTGFHGYLAAVNTFYLKPQMSALWCKGKGQKPTSLAKFYLGKH